MENPPEKTTEDTAHAIVKGIVSAIPTAGGPLSVLLETVFASPIERRREKWFTQLAEVISELEQQVADNTLEKLSQNELFITVALQATQIALRNHQDEKLSALKGAVLHAGFPEGPDAQLQLMFLQFVDEFTPLHLAILALLNDPVRWMEGHQIPYPSWNMGGVSTVIKHCFPTLSGRSEIYEQIVRDLQTRGLLQQGQFLNGAMTGSGMVASRTTEIGRAFIAYTSEDA